MLTCTLNKSLAASVLKPPPATFISVAASQPPFIVTMATVTTGDDYDRLKEVKRFDESKVGVKGLLDAGVTTIPRFFHHPPENLPGPKPTNRPQLTVPVIDLSGERSMVIEEIRRSAYSIGFFQIVNHGIPQKLRDSVINDTKKFFEQPTEYKMQFYRRGLLKGAAYTSNFDLYQSKAANWRDTLQIMSNDKYKSAEHRVLANPAEGARVSLVVFFNPSNREGVFGPLPELTSAEEPAAYQEFVLADYMNRFFAKGLDGKTLTDFYRINTT